MPVHADAPVVGAGCSGGREKVSEQLLPEFAEAAGAQSSPHPPRADGVSQSKYKLDN